ncbi:4-hydroxybenzoyl-CoA reductase subunit beta [Ramlibacter sp.]|uniref:4-hydroxybenzoyl-CoA reductase subunit beta n=1 Tax=Ramlibacter sp. TaxID=1917967 RepID=UPI002D43F8A2|nr:4-hydroxybenzoyl-CoA reductase subunit beta [Ramlibacter sp.]HYD77642.1 4-hydroxybenzoyl-CoA reductase subunit beta [Ramlibacter sp.]
MNALHELRTLRPATVDEAVRAMADTGAQPLGGGTDLLPNLRRGLGTPRALVDLTAVEALGAVAVQADGSLRLGATATLAALAGHAAVRAGWPALAKAAALVAGPTHREAATLGGNLCQDTRCVFYNQSDWWRAGNGYCLKYRGDKCHVVVKSDRCYATYHGDVAPALMALDATAEVLGLGGSRTLPLAALFVEDGQRRLTLAPGEWLAAVVVPPAAGWRADYAKARVRDAVDFPLAGAGVALKREGDRLAGLRVAITGTNSAPLAVPTDSVVGRPWDAEAAALLAKAVTATGNVLSTTVAPVKYRRRMLQALVRKLVDELWAQPA